MSHSRKKTPIFGNTTASTEKADKRRWNRVFRRVNKKLIELKKEPVKIEVIANVWSGDKDGKQYWRGYSKKDMRK
ncbi:MAG: hypothetical protein EOP46_04160 [Sphingobacteriaceae bacterium]|nr:MAG: hypothetical protein EOP46_04160 [Sphingobacteriaceae bacterium]